MSAFVQHTRESAPEGGAEILDRVQKTYGLVPNLLSTMVESPVTARAYMDIHDALAESSFSAQEQQLLVLAISRLNRCHYCMAAESTVAKMVKTEDAVIEALRTGEPLADERLQTLRAFAEAVVEQRGWVGEDAVQSFLEAGFTRAQLLEVVLAVTKKTLSNYVNHMVETPVDEPFADFTWTSPEPAGV